MTPFERLIESGTAETFSQLPSKDLPVLIDAAIELDRRARALADLVDAAKARLRVEAERELKSEKLPVEGNNWQWTSEKGCVARVSFPKPGLLRSFWLHKGDAYTRRGDETVKLGDLEKLCDGPTNFGKLFAKYFKPAKAFRELAKVLLKPAAAEKLIDICTEDSAPRVTFETKQGN